MIRSSWLTGCPEQNKLFCFPCLLFSKGKKTAWSDYSEGYSDLNHMETSAKKHEGTLAHTSAYVEFQMMGKNKQRIDYMLSQQQSKKMDEKKRETIRENRNILKRLIDGTVLLAKQELPFRGHDESETSNSKGNFVEILGLLRQYDSLLDSHLSAKKAFKGTSSDIQNDLIKSISDLLSAEISAEVTEAQWVSSILDDCSDVVSGSQLSIVLRYVSKDMMVIERFIKFIDVSEDRTAEGLYEIINDFAIEYSIGPSKLVAQTYDGACVMTGHSSGLQTRVKDNFPNAHFVHCSAHRLNLVLEQSLNREKSTSECRIFFQTLNGLSSFFFPFF